MNLPPASAHPLESDDELLALINATLEAFRSRQRYNVIRAIEGTENLRGRRIVHADDDLFVMEQLTEALLTATRGTSSFVLHNKEEPALFAGNIIAHAPEVVLMDYQLRGFVGPQVVEEIARLGPNVKCVGFSARQVHNKEFTHVIGTVVKNTTAPYESLQELSHLLRKQA